MFPAGSIDEEPSKHLFFQDSIWMILLGIEPSSITLALSFICGLAILVMCLECTLLIEGNGRYHYIPLITRTALALPAGVLYLDAVFAKHFTGHHHFESGFATIGLYGLFKVWEVCIAPLLDGSPSPVWLRDAPPYHETNGGPTNNTRSSEKVVVAEGSFIEVDKPRLGYSLDLITTLRGVSWLGDRHFDFLPALVISERKVAMPKLSFIRDRIAHFLLVCLCYDVCDTITKSQRWVKVEDLVHSLPDGTITMTSIHDPAYAHQITTRPFYQQTVFVLIVAVTTQLSLETFYTLLAIICVGLFNVSPKAFPHFFSSPISIHTDSVRSFWGARWHLIFRRVFDRAIDPWIQVFGIPKHSALRVILKVLAVFTISGFVHCVIQARTLVYYFPPGFTPQLFDTGTLWFFLSQPAALFIEHFVVRPITRLLPPPLAYLVRRVWTWSWLFWSGRWWADTWVKMGMWQPNEKVVFFSPIRGLWKGDWTVNTQ